MQNYVSSSKTCFFSPKENIKQTKKKKKIRNFSIMRLESKISHPRLCRAFD